MTVSAALTPRVRARVRALLGQRKLDGWLLFDFHGLDPVATRVLGVEGLATRRLFVLLPAAGRPVAVAHRDELGRLEGFPGEIRPYAAWREMEQELSRLLAGKTVAMAYSPRDAVPDLDLVPAGVLELVRASGAQVVSSADLVTDLAARWSPEEMEVQRRAAAALKSIALAAFEHVRAEFAAGGRPTEYGVQQWVLEAMARDDLSTDDPPRVGSGANTADPRHEPTRDADIAVRKGEVLLLALRGGVRADTVHADQTWMAFVGRTPPDEVEQVWKVVRDARDQVVAVLGDRWREGWSVTGADLDDAARKVVTAAGYGEQFVHRTGHSIDRALHGSGPHLDNYETHDDRVLAPGVGFSVEPGIYLAGRFGVRSGINVVMHEEGPEVTPEGPQQDLVRLDVPLA